MSARGIVGAVFVDGTVTNECYYDVLTNNFIPVIQSDPEFDLIWFIQDGTGSSHRTSNESALLEEHFQNPVIALGDPYHSGMGINWPPYSPDFKLYD
ncbi:uncharacterized protein NPIL_670331 [Nephila pilipes]|uniref:Uncharacterized protein n=1 Tax=Nephila pilipes TaxID=299642 RepID=A0A8X6PEK8_NEPPI|nr:uncharacterized protein NPIL_670331 [Nephila pilipes]